MNKVFERKARKHASGKRSFFDAQSTGGKLKGRPEKFHRLFITEGYWELIESPQ